jgi:hypothetical protein
MLRKGRESKILDVMVRKGHNPGMDFAAPARKLPVQVDGIRRTT